MISLVLFDINLIFDKITDRIKCSMAMKNSIIYKKSINKKWIQLIMMKNSH